MIFHRFVRAKRRVDALHVKREFRRRYRMDVQEIGIPHNNKMHALRLLLLVYLEELDRSALPPALSSSRVELLLQLRDVRGRVLGHELDELRRLPGVEVCQVLARWAPRRRRSVEGMDPDQCGDQAGDNLDPH
jgi:hypothetical protein